MEYQATGMENARPARHAGANRGTGYGEAKIVHVHDIVAHYLSPYSIRPEGESELRCAPAREANDLKTIHGFVPWEAPGWSCDIPIQRHDRHTTTRLGLRDCQVVDRFLRPPNQRAEPPADVEDAEWYLGFRGRAHRRRHDSEPPGLAAARQRVRAVTVAAIDRKTGS